MGPIKSSGLSGGDPALIHMVAAEVEVDIESAGRAVTAARLGLNDKLEVYSEAYSLPATAGGL